MNNLRLTIVMFILGTALACAMLAGFGGMSGTADASGAQPGDGRGAGPVVSASAFIPAGLNHAPWEGTASTPPEKPTTPSSTAKPMPAPSSTSPANAEGVVVVELFTSEGCSSCPPADRVLADLARAHASDPWFFAMAFHVDYWDKLGWKDRFADPLYTRRQSEYASSLPDGGTYTPQMVVNGERGFVGSDKDKADAAIAEFHNRPVSAKSIALKATTGAIKPGESCRVEATLIRTPAADAAMPRVLACLIEDGLASQATRGENSGRRLTHERVVRAMAWAAVDKEGVATCELKAPADCKPEKCRVLVLAQKGINTPVLGATLAASRP